MTTQTITVPDIGSDEAAEVVEICVAVGDQLELEQSIIVLETDKASVEVPSSHAGKISAILVKEGDQIKTGAPIVEIEMAGESDDVKDDPEAKDSSSDSDAKEEADSPAEKDASENAESKKSSKKAEAPQAKKNVQSEQKNIVIPDLGGADGVDVIEVCVAVGDEVAEGDSLLVLETDKASLEVPSPFGGKIVELSIKEGAKVKEGQVIGVMTTGGGKDSDEGKASDDGDSSDDKNTSEVKEPAAKPKKAPEKTADTNQSKSSQTPAASSAPARSAAPPSENQGEVYAGPAVRKLARQLGVDLAKVKPSGPRSRSTKEDVRLYVRELIANKSSGSAIPSVPAVDFSKFGSVERTKRSKIHRATANNMHRSWLNVPHVTQFDEADISDLETYRKEQKSAAEKRGVKLSPVPFLIKACALTLRAEPSFNVSLDPDGEYVIQKDYVHIGMAVDTPAGLMVPVLRDVDKKSVWDIAADITELATKARDGKLQPKDMQGGCFTVSSLGAIGGQGFTPIVNTPEVGILGVSKASIKPWWDGKNFVPRTFIPLSLSYDHRAVNGADAGRFLTYLVELIQAVDELKDKE